MPPATYWSFNREWDSLTDGPRIGRATVTTDYSSSDATKGAVSIRAAVDGKGGVAPTARFAYTHCIFQSAVAISPENTPRPWLTVGPLKTGAETAFAASHYVGGGLTGDSGKPALEWTLEHPTFAANMQIEPDCRGAPLSGTASVAACEKADVGVRFKYDAFRSGLLDYAIGARYAMCGGRFLAAFWDAKSRASATLSGKVDIAAGQHTMPMQYALNVSDNGATVGAAFGISSPCGRNVNATLKATPKSFTALPALDATLVLISPLTDSWKLQVAFSPTKYVANEKYFGIQLAGI